MFELRINQLMFSDKDFKKFELSQILKSIRVRNFFMQNNYKSLLDLYLPLIIQDPVITANQTSSLSFPRISSVQIIDICEHVKTLFQFETTILEVYSPVLIVGDIHGHVVDLFRVLRTCGMPPRRKYIFLGDLVDRGEFSIETVVIIFLLKLVYTDHVYLIRGNHEFSSLCQQSGFFSEIIQAFDEPSVYNSCLDVFSYLPLAIKIDNQYLCVHGGIGPEFTSLSLFRNVHRPMADYGDDDFICSVLWSDPTDENEEFMPSTRGSGYLFGRKTVDEFCEKNHIKMIIRGHECVNEGIEFKFDNKLVTVFSASNYCGIVDNKAAVLEIKANSEYTPHVFPPLPYLKRCDVAFGRSQPPTPPSMPSPYSQNAPSPRIRIALSQNSDLTLEPFGKLSKVIPPFDSPPKTPIPSLEAPLSRPKFMDSLPTMIRYPPVRRGELVRPSNISPRKRRKSNVF